MSFFLKNFSHIEKNGNSAIELLKLDICIKYFNLVKVTLKAPLEIIKVGDDGVENCFVFHSFVSSRELMDMVVDNVDIDLAFSAFNVFFMSNATLNKNDFVWSRDELINAEDLQKIVDGSKNFLDKSKSQDANLPTSVFLHKEIKNDDELHHLKFFEGSRTSIYNKISDNLFYLLPLGLTKNKLAHCMPLELIEYKTIHKLMENPVVVDKIIENWGEQDWNDFVQNFIDFKLLGNRTSISEGFILEKKRFNRYYVNVVNDLNNSHYTQIFDKLSRKVSNEDAILFKLKHVRGKMNMNDKNVSVIGLDQVPFLIESFKSYSKEEIVSAIVGNFISSSDSVFVGDFLKKIVDSKKVESFEDEEKDDDLKKVVFFEKKLNLRKFYQSRFPNFEPDYKELSRVCLCGDMITSKNLHNFIHNKNAWGLKEIMEIFNYVANSMKVLFAPNVRNDSDLVVLSAGSINISFYVSDNISSEQIGDFLSLLTHSISAESLDQQDFLIEVDVLIKKWLIDCSLAICNEQSSSDELSLSFYDDGFKI